MMTNKNTNAAQFNSPHVREVKKLAINTAITADLNRLIQTVEIYLKCKCVKFVYIRGIINKNSKFFLLSLF